MYDADEYWVDRFEAETYFMTQNYKAGGGAD